MNQSSAIMSHTSSNAHQLIDVADPSAVELLMFYRDAVVYAQIACLIQLLIMSDVVHDVTESH